MEYIESILCDCGNDTFSKHKKLYIRFRSTEWKHEMFTGIHIVMTRIINALNISGIKQFRLNVILDLHSDFKKKSKEIPMNEWVNGIHKMKQNYLTDYECNDKRIRLIVSNIGCVIDEYKQTFLGWFSY